MQLIVVWPQGSKLPVRVSRSAPVSELAHLLRFACRGDKKLVFFHKGILLDQSQTFDELGIKPSSLIDVRIVEKDAADLVHSMQDPVENEMLRLTDLRNKKRDSEMGVMPGKEESTSDDTFEPPTVVSAKPVAIREDPLPEIWNKKQEVK